MSRANARPRSRKSLSTRKTSPDAIHGTAPAGSKVLRKFFEAKNGPLIRPHSATRNPGYRAKLIRIWYRGLQAKVLGGL